MARKKKAVSEDQFNRAVGVQLALHREKLALDHKAASALTGIKALKLKRIESGKSAVSLWEADVLATAYKIPLPLLIEGSLMDLILGMAGGVKVRRKRRAKAKAKAKRSNVVDLPIVGGQGPES